MLITYTNGPVGFNQTYIEFAGPSYNPDFYIQITDPPEDVELLGGDPEAVIGQNAAGTHKIALSTNGGTMRASMDGGAASAPMDADVTTATTFILTCRDDDRYIEKVIFYTPIDDADLPALST